jgi:la-related protein 1
MSTFSYAQAAKGNSGTPTPSKTPSEPEKIDTPAAEQTSTETTTETAPAPVETEAPQKADKAVTEENDDDFTTVTNKHAAKSKALTSRTSSPNVRTGSKSRKSKEDDSSNTANGSTETSEKQVPSEGQTEKAEGAAEKSSDKSEDSEKNVPPKELKAAPLPSVNIWQQRREAQDLKVKTVPKSAATGKAATTKVASNADEAQQDSSKVNTKKKGTENAPEGTKDRKKTEGGKGRDAGKDLLHICVTMDRAGQACLVGIRMAALYCEFEVRMLT